MRLVGLYIAILLVVVGCTSTRSSIKNVDNTVVKPKVIQDRFVLEPATDGMYGFSTDYPINLGFEGEVLSKNNLVLFFNSIEGDGGEALTYTYVESCCPFPTHNQTIGAGMLEKYKIDFAGGNRKPVFVYINFFERGKLLVPKGFRLKKD